MMGIYRNQSKEVGGFKTHCWGRSRERERGGKESYLQLGLALVDEEEEVRVLGLDLGND